MLYLINNIVNELCPCAVLEWVYKPTGVGEYKVLAFNF